MSTRPVRLRGVRHFAASASVSEIKILRPAPSDANPARDGAGACRFITARATARARPCHRRSRTPGRTSSSGSCAARDRRRALQAVVSGEDAAGDARGVGVPIDLCELARADAGAAQGLLRWPEKLLPGLRRGAERRRQGAPQLADGYETPRLGRGSARRGRGRHCPPLSPHRKPNVRSVWRRRSARTDRGDGRPSSSPGPGGARGRRRVARLDQRCEHVFAVKPDAAQGNVFEAPKRCPGQDGRCGSRRFVEAEGKTRTTRSCASRSMWSSTGRFGAIPAV